MFRWAISAKNGPALSPSCLRIPEGPDGAGAKSDGIQAVGL